jgi:hypothetical protein
VNVGSVSDVSVVILASIIRVEGSIVILYVYMHFSRTNPLREVWAPIISRIRKANSVAGREGP